MKKILTMIAVTVSSFLIGTGFVSAAQTGIVNGTGVRLRAGAGTTYSMITTLSYGASLTINGSTSVNNSGCDSGLWYNATLGSSNGYVCADFINLVAQTTNNSTASSDYEKVLQNAGFPSSYWSYLTALHNAHPSWQFKALNTNLDWNSVLLRESNLGVSLIQGSEGYRSTASGSYNYYNNAWTALDGSNWYAANSKTVAYYLDPRNWLAENTIFQFEDLSYNSTYHTKEMVTNILSATNLKNYDSNYADSFMTAANNYHVSPIYLASRVRQEIGTSTAVISGASFSYNLNNYSNLYNPYNIGATSGADNWKKGLIWANGGESGTNKTYGRPWKSLSSAIIGGANYIANGYISNNQHTNYLQRFNVANGEGNVANHQYMTNVAAPSSEAKSTYSTYNSYGILNSSFIFAIPVYNNMSTSSTLPNNGNPNNYLSSLSINGSNITGFNGGNEKYTVTVGSNTSSVNITATKLVSSSGSISGTGTINLTGTSTIAKVTVTAGNGDTKTYTITINRTSTPIISDKPTPVVNNTTSVANIISKAGYSANNNYLTGINVGTSASALTNKINSNGGTSNVKTNSGLVKSSILATGDRVTITSSGSTITYTAVVSGDTNGDGKISAVDYVSIKNHITSSTMLSSVYKEAADVNKDGKISAVDYVNVKNYILDRTSVIR